MTDLKIGIPIGENQILKWGMPKEELLRTGNPDVKEDQMFARWKGIKLFNDTMVDVTVSFYSENPNGKLEYVRIECPDIEENENAPWEIYHIYSVLFNETFGIPKEKGTFGNRPFERWVFGNHEITIGVAERFMDYSIFVIKHRPRLTGIQRFKRLWNK